MNRALKLHQTMRSVKQRRLTALSSPGQIHHDFRKAVHNSGHTIVVQSLGSIGWPMVVLVPERGGVGNHDRRIACLPEGPMIRPTDTRNCSRNSCSFGGKFGTLTKRPNRSADQLARFDIADEADEIPF